MRWLTLQGYLYSVRRSPSFLITPQIFSESRVDTDVVSFVITHACCFSFFIISRFPFRDSPYCLHRKFEHVRHARICSWNIARGGEKNRYANYARFLKVLRKEGRMPLTVTAFQRCPSPLYGICFLPAHEPWIVDIL